MISRAVLESPPADAGSSPSAGSTGTANVPAAGWSALHLAATEGDTDHVRRLLAAGSAVDERSVHPHACTGATALHCAVALGHVEVARVLIAAGASVGARDEAGYTPLLLAAERGDLPMVRLLLRAGARPGCELGDTSPLAAARRGRHGQVVALLRQVCGSRQR